MRCTREASVVGATGAGVDTTVVITGAAAELVGDVGAAVLAVVFSRRVGASPPSVATSRDSAGDIGVGRFFDLVVIQRLEELEGIANEPSAGIVRMDNRASEADAALVDVVLDQVSASFPR